MTNFNRSISLVSWLGYWGTVYPWQSALAPAHLQKHRLPTSKLNTRSFPLGSQADPPFGSMKCELCSWLFNNRRHSILNLLVKFSENGRFYRLQDVKWFTARLVVRVKESILCPSTISPLPDFHLLQGLRRTP